MLSRIPAWRTIMHSAMFTEKANFCQCGSSKDINVHLYKCGMRSKPVLTGLHNLMDHLLQLDLVLCKSINALLELVHSHLVLPMQLLEGLHLKKHLVC